MTIISGIMYNLDASGCTREGCHRAPAPFYRYREVSVDGGSYRCAQSIYKFMRLNGLSRRQG